MSQLKFEDMAIRRGMWHDVIVGRTSAAGLTSNGRQQMKNPIAFFSVILLSLGILALYLASQALHRGNVALFIVLIFASLIVWKRLQRTGS
jgi:hypothetical protein